MILSAVTAELNALHRSMNTMNAMSRPQFSGGLTAMPVQFQGNLGTMHTSDVFTRSSASAQNERTPCEQQRDWRSDFPLLGF